tara:strand:- start:204 stop:356 length:153 start_codon:yes stop_codon:yes gene_type:complete
VREVWYIKETAKVKYINVIVDNVNVKIELIMEKIALIIAVFMLGMLIFWF